MARTKEEQAQAIKQLCENIRHAVTVDGIHDFIMVPNCGTYTVGGKYLNLPDIVILFDGYISGGFVNEILACLRDSPQLHDLPADTSVVRTLPSKTVALDEVRVKFRRIIGDDLHQHFAFNHILHPNANNWLQVYIPNEQTGKLPGEEGYEFHPEAPDWNFEDNVRRFYSDDEPVRPNQA